VTFLDIAQVPICSPITIPKSPNNAMIGGAGLLTRMRPYNNPTNKPTASEMNIGFMAFLLTFDNELFFWCVET
jgi:hypothetical protein